MKARHLALLLSVLVNASAYVPAQPTCYSDYGASYYVAAMPSVFPALNTGMSNELLLSHIALDSVCRELDRVTIDSIFTAWSTFDDTLKTVVKHALFFIDADPITAHMYSYNDHYHVRFKELKGRIAKLASSLSSSPGQDLALLSSDYILMISVSSVSEYVDTSAVLAVSVVETTASVEDTILGQVLPTCQIPPSTLALTNPPTQQCIRIDIRRENVASFLMEKNLDYDSADVEECLPMSGDYLAFLKIVNLCYTDSAVAYFITANSMIGEHRGIYKIDGAGNISDPGNFFGLGLAPSAQSVINAIESRRLAMKGH